MKLSVDSKALKDLEKTLKTYQQFSKRTPEEIVRKNFVGGLLVYNTAQSFFFNLAKVKATRQKIKSRIGRIKRLIVRKHILQKTLKELQTKPYTRITATRLEFSSTPQKGFRKNDLNLVQTFFEKLTRYRKAGRTQTTVQPKFFKANDLVMGNSAGTSIKDLSRLSIKTQDTQGETVAEMSFAGDFGEGLKLPEQRQALAKALYNVRQDLIKKIRSELKKAQGKRNQ